MTEPTEMARRTVLWKYTKEDGTHEGGRTYATEELAAEHMNVIGQMPGITGVRLASDDPEANQIGAPTMGAARTDPEPAHRGIRSVVIEPHHAVDVPKDLAIVLTRVMQAHGWSIGWHAHPSDPEGVMLTADRDGKSISVTVNHASH
jgi:hypothetical protein